MEPFEIAKRNLFTKYQLDIVRDVLLDDSNRVFFYGNHKEENSMTLHLISGDVALLGFTEGEQIIWSSLFQRIDYHNQYALIAGKDEYLHYVSTRFFDYSKDQDFSIPLQIQGKKRWIRIIFHSIKKNPSILLFQMTDVSELLNTEEEIYYKTHHDSLTKLLNKYALDYQYGLRYQLPNFHVMYLDLDYFKEINDQYGHIIGNRFLEQFALILQSYQSDFNRFYRIGGDEFVGLFFDSSESIMQIAEAIRSRTHDIQVDCHQAVSVSIGIIRATIREDVIRKADQAMYRAKAKGKNQIVFASEDDWH